jgi:glycosyltransferase involved in cell wall biosynthesis
MGYLENILPKYLARHGVDVHVIATDLPPYFQAKTFTDCYVGFHEKAQPGAIEYLDGFTLHVLAHKKVAGYVRVVGLWNKLCSLCPEIVQTTTPIGWIALDSALYKPLLGYKLFTGCHTTASVFPLAKQTLPWWYRERLRCTVLRGIPGRLTSVLSEKCYGATSDCADVGVRFFGVQKRKMDISPLGVDTELFSPISSAAEQQARQELRQHLGFSTSDIVCIYTGRFGEDKNPLLLAKAVAHLVKDGQPFRGLFVGNGPQGQTIQSCAGCSVHAFVPVYELPKFFRACDIGVWPTQESTSMLDAAACGLPIVVNDTIVATERVEGNGLRYKLNDLEDLAQTVLRFRDPAVRQRLGSFGAQKIARHFSWDALARRRLHDYELALHSGRPVTRKLNGRQQPDADSAECSEATEPLIQ